MDEVEDIIRNSTKDRKKRRAARIAMSHMGKKYPVRIEVKGNTSYIIIDKERAERELVIKAEMADFDVKVNELIRDKYYTELEILKTIAGLEKERDLSFLQKVISFFLYYGCNIIYQFRRIFKGPNQKIKKKFAKNNSIIIHRLIY